MSTNQKGPGPLDGFRAFADGNLDYPLANDRQAQTALVDDAGRVWVRLHSGTGPVGPGDPIPVNIVAPDPLPVNVVGDLENVTWVEAGVLLNQAVVVNFQTTLMQILATNTDQNPYYFQIFDSAALPLAGAVPVFVAPLAGSGAYSLSTSRTMAAGITWAISSTPDTYTAVAGSFVWVNTAHKITP